MVEAGSCSSNSTPSLGTSTCRECGPKKTKERKEEGRKTKREGEKKRNSTGGAGHQQGAGSGQAAAGGNGPGPGPRSASGSQLQDSGQWLVPCETLPPLL